MLRACVLLAVLLMTALPVHGQPIPLPGAFAFNLDSPQPLVVIDINGNGFVDLIITDQSRDSAASVPGLPAFGLPHETSFVLTPQISDPGWSAGTPAPVTTFGGQTVVARVPFAVIGATKMETYVVNITATFRSQQTGETLIDHLTVGARTPGLLNLVATVKDTPILKPREFTTVRVEIQNLGLFETFYDMKVLSNPCQMPLGFPHDTYAGPKETVTATIELKSPWQEKLWYLSENCEVTLKVFPRGFEDQMSVTATISVQVNGQSIFHLEKLFPVFVFLLILLVIILLVLRRKARIEEEILGKPQKPWLIPVEALYLTALRKKDERAWYVVRHHLMEEEYRSALFWYHSYKKATKGSRKKEGLVLRQEKSYERWKAKWEKDIARPLKEADRFEAKLQRKLDRKARKLDRKDASKVQRVTKKLAAAHAKQVERALEKWTKEVRKAEKKGLAAPKRPVVPEPDYPEEPEPRAFLLSGHKWSRKAERFRARRVREQGDLEVKFEKADARRLAQLRRKVQRLARKLDDPDFVAEHPLLQAEA